MVSNYVFLVAPGKKGYQINNENIIEVVTTVLKDRDTEFKKTI